MSFIKSFILLAIISMSVLLPQTYAKTIFEGWEQTGITSYYSRSLNGNKTASGERYRHFGAMTAAHKSLPFGTKIQVTDVDTGKSIIVKVNDRGPFVRNRVLDLSGMAAKSLGITRKGVCNVDIKVLSLPAPKVKKVDKPIQPKRKLFNENRLDLIEQLISANYDVSKLS